MDYLTIKPDDARVCESKYNSNQASPHTKEKDYFSYLFHEYDLTQKKHPSYYHELK